MSFRLAAYAVCIQEGKVLLVRQVTDTWSLPGGKVEHGEDPIDAVIREFAEETGCEAVIDCLLGVDSRVVPAAERNVPGMPKHHNIGIYYLTHLARGNLRSEPNGETVEPMWIPIADVALLSRSSLVDIGIALAEKRPANGHVEPLQVQGLVQH